MEPTDLELRPLATVPRADIVDLLRTSMGDGSRRSEDFWRWKHEDNPFGHSPGVAAYVGGALAGIRVFLRWQLVSGESTLRVVRAVDTATHPNWRRLGLFRKMTLALLDQVGDEGVDFVFNTPNARSEAGYVTMGWRALGRVSMLARPAAPWTWPRRSANAQSHEDTRSIAGSSIAALLEEPRLDAFLARLGTSERRLHTPWSAPYLHWRYLQPPGLDYAVRWRIDDSGSGAIVVARSSPRRGLRVLLLAEVLVSPDAAGASIAASLLLKLSTFGDHHYAVAHAARGTAERRALMRSGFVLVPRVGPRLAIRPVSPSQSGADPVSIDSWRLAVGDLEVF